MTTNDKNTVTLTVENAIINSFDVEYVKASIRAKNNIGLIKMDHFESIGQKYLTKQLYTFFLPESLEQLNNWIYGDEAVRDMLLNIMQKARYTVFSDRGGDTHNTWLAYAQNVTEAISFESAFQTKAGDEDADHVMMPKAFAATIYLEREDLYNVLKKNPHLLVLYTIIQNFEKTAIFLAMAENTFSDKKPSGREEKQLPKQ